MTWSATVSSVAALLVVSTGISWGQMTPLDEARARLEEGADDTARSILAAWVADPGATPTIQASRWDQVGESLLLGGRGDVWLALLDSQVDARPEDLDIRFRRGLARRDVKQLRSAKRDLEFVLDRRPRDPEVRRALAVASLISFDHGQAEAYGAEVEPDLASAQGHLARELSAARSRQVWVLVVLGVALLGLAAPWRPGNRP